MFRLVALGFAAIMLVGCDVVQDDQAPPAKPAPPPAPIAARSSAPPPAYAPPPAPAEAVSKVIVRPGQTLYAVSREHNVPVRSLIDANNLSPPYLLRSGQTLTIPSSRQYVVQSGDTLYGVSRRTGVEAATLARLNHLEPPYVLKTGVAIIMPPPAEAVSVASAPPSSVIPLPPPTPKNGLGGNIAVEQLAPPTQPPPPVPPAKPSPAAPAAPPAASAPPTPLAPPPPVATPAAAPPVVATLVLPQPAATPAPAAPAAAAPKPPAKAAPPPTPAGDDDASAPPEPESGAPSPAAHGTAAPEVAAIVANHHAPSPPLFYWPVRGKVLSAFGPAAGGTHNDGINIAAPEGTEVDAAESGVVAYAGDELHGFGNLLLIKHADGWVTAYAHNKELLVAKGDHVKRGQPIAKIGDTGGVGRPQLHFELRQGTKAIDPLDHLPAAGSDAG